MIESPQLIAFSEDPKFSNQFKELFDPAEFELIITDIRDNILTQINQESSTSLVLIDYTKPNKQKLEICWEIRKNFGPNEVPIVLLVDHVKSIYPKEWMEVGINDFIIKPFSKEKLLFKIETQLQINKVNRAAVRFVPSDFLNVIGKDSITETRLGDHATKEVTILFTDIRDYTTISESMSPEDNFFLVNAYHRRMGPHISNNNGFVNQFLGDGIMSIFPNLPDDALRSTIGMQQYLRNYNKERMAKGRQKLRVGMGMHTGMLTMGITGDGQLLDAATIADSVNTASRMEGLTKIYGAPILLSSDSFDKLQNPDDFHFRYLGKVQLKGKKKIVGVYECFDSYSTEHKEKKLETLDTFNEALNTYLNKEFANACILFKKVLHQNPEDTTSQLFLTRAEHHLANGTPDNWEGVEIMQSK